MQHHVPAAPLDAVDHPVEHGHVRRAAEMLYEVEAHAADTARFKCVEIPVGETIANDRDAAIPFEIRRDAVEHRRIVGAVAACLTNDSPFDSELSMMGDGDVLL